MSRQEFMASGRRVGFDGPPQLLTEWHNYFILLVAEPLDERKRIIARLDLNLTADRLALAQRPMLFLMKEVEFEEFVAILAQAQETMVPLKALLVEAVSQLVCLAGNGWVGIAMYGSPLAGEISLELLRDCLKKAYDFMTDTAICA